MKTENTTEAETTTDSPDVAGCAAMPCCAKRIEESRAKARDKWGWASPYRVGIAMAELGYEKTSPYLVDSRADRNFADGYNWFISHNRAGLLRQAEEGADREINDKENTE